MAVKEILFIGKYLTGASKNAKLSVSPFGPCSINDKPCWNHRFAISRPSIIIRSMKLSDLKTHGLWAVGLVGAFYLGTNWQSNPGSSDGEKFGQGSSSRIVSSASSSSGSGALGPNSRSARTASDRTEVGNAISQIFNTPTLSKDGIAALTTQALNDPNQIKRRLAFSQLLTGMTADNASSIRDQLVEAGANGQEWRDFNYAWGAIAGEEAFLNSSVSDKRDLESLISGWAATDPSGAIAMLGNLPENLADQKKRLENGIVAGLADRDPDEATEYVTALAAGGREDTSRLMERITYEVIRQGGTKEASAWVTTLDDGPLKGAAMNEVAERYVRTDPESAASWVEQFADQDYAARAVREVGKEWAEKEPLAAVTWLNNLPEGNGQNSGLNSAFGDWEDKDPVAAGEYLLTMPESPKRDSAISGFANGYAYQDPETAIAWAQDISNPEIKAQTLTRVGEAYFRRDPKAALEWLPTSGLSLEAQAKIAASRSRRRR